MAMRASPGVCGNCGGTWAGSACLDCGATLANIADATKHPGGPAALLLELLRHGALMRREQDFPGTGPGGKKEIDQ